MDSAARFCLGWGVFVGLPFVVMGGRVPECLETSEFATIVATTTAMLVFGVAGVLNSWMRSGDAVSFYGFIGHCRTFFRGPEEQAQPSPQIDNQEQEVVQ